MLGQIGGAVLMLAFAAVPTVGQTIESAYTKFNTKNCKHARGVDVESYGSWVCPGYAGLRVRLSAGDQRMFVTYGAWQEDDLARSQTFPGFNDVYQGTVEWRIEKAPDSKTRPFATILRWNVVLPQDRDRASGPVQPNGRVLVVTRLGPGGVCHVGYVDARANPAARALARKIADERARQFRCGNDKRIVLGKVGGIEMPR